jgi:hypothetical protein
MDSSAVIYYSTGSSYTKTSGKIYTQGDALIISFADGGFEFFVEVKSDGISLRSTGEIKYFVDFRNKNQDVLLATPYGTAVVSVAVDEAEYRATDDGHFVSLAFSLDGKVTNQKRVLKIRGKVK